ncbi:hypothetical protein GCM10023213_05980 [Prosthecobacter algae]|uniref:Uncharacterized protein n=1 Tax=Prosthecobacter algae TaxID=1144682 RepID=A0ABP9NVJ5_9BACT
MGKNTSPVRLDLSLALSEDMEGNVLVTRALNLVVVVTSLVADSPEAIKNMPPRS